MKIAAEAAARIQAIDQALAGAKSVLESAEKSLAEATAGVTSNQAPVAALNASLKRWNAATINTKALATRREAADTVTALEESQLTFSKSAGLVSQQFDTLNAKRAERAGLTRFLQQKSPSPEVSEDIRATLAAIDISIDRQLEALQQAENELLATRDTIDQSAPTAHGKAAEADSLRAAYRKALE